MTELTDEAVNALLDGATENAYDLEVVKWGGGIRCVYLNDYRVAGEKPWGGGDTTRRFKVRMADIMRAFRGTVQAAAPDLARALLDARAELAQARADADAAVALAYETAADLHAKLWRETSGYKEAQIRALAPADGLAAVEALRATADGYKHAAEGFAAELAAAKQRERALVEALETGRHYVHQLANGGLPGSCEASEDLTGIDAALAEVQADARREGGSPLTDETPAQHEERTCTCGAGHGSLEGHMDWCDFTAYQSLNALAEVQARDDAPTPPDTWHERRTMLPDGDARKEGGK